MKRPHRHPDGYYLIKGKKYPELFGSREQVMNGTAYKTTGGLTTHELTMNKWGRIVSTLKHNTAKKEKRLEKYGFYAKKGKFGYVKKGTRKNKSSRKMKGGTAHVVPVPVPPAHTQTTTPPTPQPASLAANGVISRASLVK
jgi:hypothetical protein